MPTHSANPRKTAAAWICAAAALLLADQAGAALDFGHLRARTRAFPTGGAAAEPSDAFLEDDSAIEDTQATRAISSRADIGGNAGERMAAGVARTPSLRSVSRGGYLAFGPPNPLRFSDEGSLNARPPSPALPEFTMLPTEYVPYLIESQLPEDARNDPTLLSEIVVDLEPHEVVSGLIDTSRLDKEEKVEHFNLEENRTTVLKPSDVLIFFETDGVKRETKAVIPFSPATPSAETIRSSATLTTE